MLFVLVFSEQSQRGSNPCLHLEGAPEADPITSGNAE
jgi:hypothetical protein